MPLLQIPECFRTGMKQTLSRIWHSALSAPRRAWKPWLRAYHGRKERELVEEQATSQAHHKDTGSG